MVQKSTACYAIPLYGRVANVRAWELWTDFHASTYSQPFGYSEVSGLLSLCQFGENWTFVVLETFVLFLFGQVWLWISNVSFPALQLLYGN